ncbi:oligosaccharide flippase family protein [bacterium]|jgi:O-antigen/teichoic acid export membrane protein|nr:oligosaccharide flippase family protein [bacterium]
MTEVPVKQSILKAVIKHAPVYFSATFITAVVATLMAKYYTQIFSPAEYGIIALYGMMLQYITTFASLNMDSASTRYYFDYRETRRDEYLSSIFYFISLLSGAVFIIGLLLMPVLVPLFQEGTEWIYFVTLVSGVVKVINSFLYRLLINEQYSKSVFRNKILHMVTLHSSAVYLISAHQMGILGKQLGSLLANGLNIAYLVFEYHKKNLFRFKRTMNWGMIKETLFLALPGAVTTLQGLAFVYLDRIFLKIYQGNAEVGVYSLGFLLGKGISMIFEAISNAMNPKIMSDLVDDYEEGKKDLEKFAGIYYVGLLGIALCTSFMSKWIVMVVSNMNYIEAASVMPYVLMGFLVGGFYKIPSSILGYHKKVWFYPALSFVAFGVNGLLNFWLIPSYSMIGAAYATFVGLFIYSTILQLMAFKYHSRRYCLGVSFLYSVIIIAVTALFPF